jgi:hypothetical protein
MSIWGACDFARLRAAIDDHIAKTARTRAGMQSRNNAPYVQIVEIRADFTGGARSLALTLLRPNSLLTGKITGNLQNFTIENRTSLL